MTEEMRFMKALLVVAVCFASSKELYAYVVPDCTIEAGEQKCDATCTARGICLSASSWAVITQCAAGEICQDDQGTAECVRDGVLTLCSSSSVNAKVTCDVAGTFPSLSSCSNYYVCTPGVTATPRDCGAGLYFDTCSGMCVAGTCPSKAPTACSTNTFIDVDPNNNRYFYICSTNGEVKWYLCDSGYAYVKGSGCVKMATCVTCNSGAGAFPYPGESCKYIWCDGSGSSQIQNCSPGFYFDSRERRCLRDTSGTC